MVRCAESRRNKQAIAACIRLHAVRSCTCLRMVAAIRYHGLGDLCMERMLATPADAEIILKLYQLRTETVMRQARAWMTGNSGRKRSRSSLPLHRIRPIRTTRFSAR